MAMTSRKQKADSKTKMTKRGLSFQKRPAWYTVLNVLSVAFGLRLPSEGSKSRLPAMPIEWNLETKGAIQ
jgi:hypothetical protein